MEIDPNVPTPPSGRATGLAVFVVGVVAVLIVAAIATGLLGRTASRPSPASPPAILMRATVPTATAGAKAGTVANAGTAANGAPANGDPADGTAASGGPRAAAGRLGDSSRETVTHRRRASTTADHVIVSRPSAAQQTAERQSLVAPPSNEISAAWMSGFYRIYEVAQRSFDVNWLLLASIQMQETDFSTAPSTYHGLNFDHCCGGPMQFNVTNGPVTTWSLVKDSYLDGKRPAVYDHRTATHPSIYDDFDSIMAAAHLLSYDGAGYALDGGSWDAAYDYYGHDETGVSYADEVIARAISWSQHGFCVQCEPESGLITDVYEAYGAPVLAALEAEQAADERAAKSVTASKSATRSKAAATRSKAAATRSKAAATRSKAAARGSRAKHARR